MLSNVFALPSSTFDASSITKMVIFPIGAGIRSSQSLLSSLCDAKKPTHDQVDALRAFPALDSDVTIAKLKEKLPAYVVAAEDVPADTQTAQWWKCQQNLPAWKTAAKVVLTVQPSSAAAERVFSLLQAATRDQQSRLLEDSLQLAIILQ